MPFPPSRMPASVEVSIKLIVCLSVRTTVRVTPSGRMGAFYHKALECYKGFEYKAFRAYIIRKMTVFYKAHGFCQTRAAKSVPTASMEAEVGYVVNLATGAVVNKSYTMSDDGSDEEDGEGGSGAASEAGGNGAALADAAPPAAAPAEGSS